MKKIVLLFLFLGISTGAFGQLNRYKYFIVSKQYPGFYKSNQYRTSTLIKHLFTQEGFPAIYDDQLPKDLVDDPCIGLWVNLIDESGMLATRTALELKDCKGNIVMTSPMIRSKEKDVQIAYHQTINESFGTFVNLGYQYESKEETTKSTVLNYNNDVKTLSLSDSKPVTSELIDASITQIQEHDKRPTLSDNQFLAIKTDGGYNLENHKGEVLYSLKETSSKTIFLVVQAEKNGLVYQENGTWYLEFDDSGSKREALDIIFQ